MQRFLGGCLALAFVFGTALGMTRPISAQSCSGGGAPSVSCTEASGCPPGYVNGSDNSTGIGASFAGFGSMLSPSQQRILCRLVPTATPSPTPSAMPASGSTASGSVVLVGENPALGSILTDAQGMTLYVRSDDSNGMSNCAAACATTWLPLQLTSGQTLTSSALGMLATFTRGNGITQVTYNGKPLYRYSGDTASGNTNGTAADLLAAVATP